jgi:DNA primase small subunit
MSIDAQAFQIYHKRLFPSKSNFQWVNHQHNPTRLFTHREWAFTLPGDVYLRWNSFNTVDELKKEAIRYNPSRFEVGAVYSAEVSANGEPAWPIAPKFYDIDGAHNSR